MGLHDVMSILHYLILGYLKIIIKYINIILEYLGIKCNRSLN